MLKNKKKGTASGLQDKEAFQRIFFKNKRRNGRKD